MMTIDYCKATGALTCSADGVTVGSVSRHTGLLQTHSRRESETVHRLITERRRHLVARVVDRA